MWIWNYRNVKTKIELTFSRLFKHLMFCRNAFAVTLPPLNTKDTRSMNRHAGQNKMAAARTVTIHGTRHSTKEYHDDDGRKPIGRTGTQQPMRTKNRPPVSNQNAGWNRSRPQTTENEIIHYGTDRPDRAKRPIQSKESLIIGKPRYPVRDQPGQLPFKSSIPMGPIRRYSQQQIEDSIRQKVKTRPSGPVGQLFAGQTENAGLYDQLGGAAGPRPPAKRRVGKVIFYNPRIIYVTDTPSRP